MLMRCPAAASRRQGCDVEPQLLELTLLTASDDVDELELVDNEMNSASLVNDTTQPRLSCTTTHTSLIGMKTLFKIARCGNWI